MTDEFSQQVENLRDRPLRTDAEAREYEFRHNILPRLSRNGWEDRSNQHFELNKGQKLILRDTTALLTNKGAIVALIGERGLGKTTLAAHLAVERAEHFWNFYSTMPENREGLARPQGIPVYRKMAQLVKQFKSLYADFGSIETERLMQEQEALCNETLLVIDELHECDELKIKDRVLTDMVDIRYSRFHDTILISNQTEEDFRRTTNNSVLSRLSEHGRVFVCKWASFRNPKP